MHRDSNKKVVTATASAQNSKASQLAAEANNIMKNFHNYNQQLKNSIIKDITLDNGSDNSGILRGSPTEESKGPLGKCLSFDGKNDYIQLSGLSNVKAVSMWVNIPSQQESGDRYLLDAPNLSKGQVAANIRDIDNQASNVGDGWHVMYVDGEKVGKRVGDLPTWQDIPKNRWVHLYLEAKTAFSGDIYIMSDRYGENKLKAKIAVVRVYNRDLTEEEIDRDRSNTIELNYMLKRVPSPRYWQPNDPVILIEGKGAKFTERHGSDGLLECQLYENSENIPLPDLIANYENTIGTKINELENKNTASNSATLSNIAFSTWTTQPWHPFLMEWEVEVLPVQQHGNLDPDKRAYDPNFIVSNYDLKENASDLSVKSGTGLTKAANVYSGSTIVTPHASIKLKKVIEAYLNEKNVLGDKSVMEQYFDENTAETASDNYLSQDKNIEKVKTWYEKTINSKTAEQKAEDAIYTAIRAYQRLQNSNSFAQALGGFNPGLLMHKQTMQLGINDPIGFEDYKPFTEQVRFAVGDRRRVAPVPLNDFNPIRSGVMSILRLRLMDTFGQVKADLNPGQLIVTEKMTPPSGYNPPAGRDWVYLPPRLVQPSRLNLYINNFLCYAK